MHTSAPIDLTTLGADVPLPHKDHDIFKHLEPRAFAAPTLEQLPMEFAKLQIQVAELAEQVLKVTRDFKSHLQMLKQEAMRNGR